MNSEKHTTVPSEIASWPAWARRCHVELLVLLFVFLLPFGETFHLPVFILLVLSVMNLRRERLPRERGLFQYVGIAVLLTAPLLVSAIGAHDPEKTLLTAFVFVLYAVAGLYVIRRFEKEFDLELLLYGISAILLFWTMDALIQYFAGRNLLGWPYNGTRLTGMFHPDMRIGIVFAHLAPFLIAAIHWQALRSGKNWTWLLLVPVIAVILLGGSRASWVTLILVLAAYSLLFLHRGVYRLWQIALVLALALGGSLMISGDLHERMALTLRGISTDVEAINEATSLRVEAWRGAWRLFQDSPITGVGVEALPELGFQRGYTRIPFGHSHFYALDVLLVSGIVGFIAYLTAFGAVCKQGFDAFREAGYAFPFWLAAAAMMFPLNVHWEFHGVRPYAMMWLLLILAFAVSNRESAAQRGV